MNECDDETGISATSVISSKPTGKYWSARKQHVGFHRSKEGFKNIFMLLTHPCYISATPVGSQQHSNKYNISTVMARFL